VFLSISRGLEDFASPALWAATLLVLALLLRRRPRVAALLAVIAVLPPLALTSPAVASALQHWADGSARNTVQDGILYDAAIVLSGNPQVRLEAGASFVAKGRARFLLYSGAVDRGQEKGALATARAYHISPNRIVFDRKSVNTRENAVYSARVVEERGWKRLVLVTSALHARRALACFRKVGVNPDLLPVPEPELPPGLWPRRDALVVSGAALHELFGYAAYRVAGYVD